MDGDLHIDATQQRLKDGTPQLVAAYEMIKDAAQSKDGALLFMQYLYDEVKRVTKGVNLTAE